MNRIIALLGFALAISPFLFGYAESIIAVGAGVTFGSAILVISFVEGLTNDHEKWEYWLDAVIGIGIIISPFILGFVNIVYAMWISVVIGAMLFLIAGSTLFFDKKLVN